jgi:transcriptional regulator with XRE-family HTH domain
MSDPHDSPQLGNALRFLRKRQGLTQQDVSQRSATDQVKALDATYISRLEKPTRGKTIQPTASTLNRLLDAMGVDSDDLNYVLEQQPWDNAAADATSSAYMFGKMAQRTSSSLDPESTARLYSNSIPETLQSTTRARRLAPAPDNQAWSLPLAAGLTPTTVDPQLQEVIDRWESLDATTKVTVLAIIKAASA